MLFQETPLILFVATGMGISLAAPLYILRRRREKWAELRAKFLQVVRTAFERATIRNLKDVDDLYLGTTEGHGVGIAERLEIVLTLRKLKAVLSSSRVDTQSHRNALSCLDDVLASAEEELKKEEQKVPFAGVPKPERSLLEDIQEISSTGSKPIIMDKLTELAAAIRLREEESKKYITEQGESLRWTKRGLVATVGFSLMSIGLAVYFYLESAGA